MVPLSHYSRLFFVLCLCGLVFTAQAAREPEWSESELALLRSQWIGSLPTLPPDPGNQYAMNPDAARFGLQLFFDSRFSSNGKVSCASCHIPEKLFTDGRLRGKGIGETSRNSPSIVGAAYSQWFFWDGRSDSLWSQALGPMESSLEHGGNRSQYAGIIYTDLDYRKTYEGLFGPLPDLSDTKRFADNASPYGDPEDVKKWLGMKDADRKAVTRVFVSMGKAIAAYERLLKPSPSRFDNYVEGLLKDQPNRNLSADEIAGLRLFIGKARCITCHQGPLFTNHAFHNIGAPDPAVQKPKYMLPLFYLFKEKPVADTGRYDGIRKALKSEFNCLSEYSDAAEDDCAELKFANTRHTGTLGAFKVPSLRNVTKTAPYMHAGQLADLREVLNHYNTAPMAPSGHSELQPLNLQQTELKQIRAFLHSLSSPVALAPELLRDPRP
jgi:cytochrome c peroxidase